MCAIAWRFVVSGGSDGGSSGGGGGGGGGGSGGGGGGGAGDHELTCGCLWPSRLRTFLRSSGGLGLTPVFLKVVIYEVEACANMRLSS